MVAKKSQVDYLIMDQGEEIITWDPKYETEIQLIDQQHKELVSLTNQLYHACLSGDQAVGVVFEESMSRMVDYVRYHFGSEQNLLQKVKYPHYSEHKKLHDDLIKSILDAAKEYNEGRKFVPNNFVRTLKDWVFGHIAIEDKVYAAYIADQKKKGFLTDREIDGLIG